MKRRGKKRLQPASQTHNCRKQTQKTKQPLTWVNTDNRQIVIVFKHRGQKNIYQQPEHNRIWRQGQKVVSSKKLDFVCFFADGSVSVSEHQQTNKEECLEFSDAHSERSEEKRCGKCTCTDEWQFSPVSFFYVLHYKWFESQWEREIISHTKNRRCRYVYAVCGSKISCSVCASMQSRIFVVFVVILIFFCRLYKQ